MKKVILLCVIVLFFNCSTFRHSQNDTIEIIQLENSEIIINNPYKNKGKLELKGSLHNHTDNSASVDGFPSGDPFDTAVKFRDQGGFDFYAFTDHNFVTKDPGVPGIIWMGNAVEDTKSTQHLIVYDLPDDYEYINMENDIQVLIDYYKSLGAIVSYAHPSWDRRYQPDDKILQVENLDFVELINGTAADGNSERAFDLLLSKGNNVFGLGVDDYHHNLAWEDPDRSFNKTYIIVFSKEKEKSSIWEALLSGCFYVVSGNTRIDINFNNGIITVSSDENSLFEFIGLNADDPGNGKVLYSIENIKEASYAINGNEGYVRVKVTNQNGTAYSQPFVILSVNEK